MKVVQLLVSAYRVHVGIDAEARLNAVLRQGEPFPLRERVDNLGGPVAHVLDGERHRPLHSVEVIVDAEALQDEKRRGDTAEPELCREILLEEVLDPLDALLGVPDVEKRPVALRCNKSAHLKSRISQ